MNDGPLSILHVLLAMGETSAPYNEHCLPASKRDNIAVCTYFKPAIAPGPRITVFSGNNTLRGFFRALKAALSAQEYDVIHAHSVHVATLLVIACLFFRRRFLAKTVYTLHSSYPNYKLSNRLMLIIAAAFFGRTVCCSRASLDSLPGFIKRLAGNRMRVVQNGMDIERVDRAIEACRSQRAGPFTLIAIGRLIDVKNPLTILRAFRQSETPSARLVMVGEGPLREALIAESRADGTDQWVRFTGLVPREQVYELLLQADLFISASHVEGLPVAVLEAMATRVPVLLSDIPAHREISAGVDFIPLVAADDAAGFAAEIKRCAELPAVEREALGQQCRKVVEDRFSLAAMQKGYRGVYAEIVSRTEAR